MMFPLDPLQILITAPALVFSLWAQWKVHSTFKHYSTQGVRTGMTGAQAAAAVLRSGGVRGVAIERHQGFLSDHYDPKAKSLRLSPDVHDGRSVSSIAVAAHEAGHAIQDAVGYTPLVLRSNLVPLCNLGNQLWFLPFVIGLLLGSSPLGPVLMWTGILMFAAVVVFQLVTLPTEFNASNRAKAVLAGAGIVTDAGGSDGCEEGPRCRGDDVRRGGSRRRAAAGLPGLPRAGPTRRVAPSGLVAQSAERSFGPRGRFDFRRRFASRCRVNSGGARRTDSRAC